MAKIRLQMLSGPNQGRRLEFDQDVLTFGRDVDRNLVVGGSFVSRQHGQLKLNGQQWFLINESPNGTEVGGKRVSGKPRPLNDRDVVSVGGQPIFEVRIDVGDPVSTVDPSADTAEPEVNDESRKTKRRSRMWVGIGIYLAFMMAFFVFLATLDRDTGKSTGPATELTLQQIQADIERPVPPVPIDERRSNEHLQRATELYNRLDSAPDALYQAYVNYRDSLAYAGRTTFESGLDQRRYRDVQARLIEEVDKRYKRAYGTLRSRDFAAAEEAFRSLTRFYPDHTSVVFINANQQRVYVAQQLKRKRR